MGRRARTNCSPIDSAMEKYHNDIGSRLSGVFVPPQPGMEHGSNPADPLNMLTLDTRCPKALTHQDTANTATASPEPHGRFDSPAADDTSSRCPRDYSPHLPISIQQKTEKSQTLPAQTPPSGLPIPSQQTVSDSFSCSEQEKEKKGLVDKLTKALFQRKHTCSRCQRKSKSCLPNKNFNTSEKHYTCGRCRETSNVMKTLVSGQSGPANGTAHLMNGGRNADVILHKPRSHLKDSGYETATSCSTVASAHSHCTDPGSSTTTTTTATTTTTKPHHIPHGVCGEELSPKDNNGTPCCGEGQHHHHSHAPHGLPLQASYRNPPPGLEQYMGVTGDHSSVQVLKQVKTRYVENYDGYLPNAQNKQDCAVKRSALPAFAKAPNSEGMDTPCYDASHSGHNPCDRDSQQCEQRDANSNSKGTRKVCYTCGTSSKPCFRLPWAGGWLCEDCLDGVY